MKQAAAVALDAFSLLQFEAYANFEVGIFRRIGRIFSVKRYKGVLVLYDVASGPAGQRSRTLQSPPQELKPEKKGSFRGLRHVCGLLPGEKARTRHSRQGLLGNSVRKCRRWMKGATPGLPQSPFSKRPF